MSFIHYNLNNSANCNGMAPAPLPAGGFTNALLPPGMGIAGTYIIVNTATNNRYVGIAGNIDNRFNTRLATVTEMGFPAPMMGLIGVTWGVTSHQNTGAPAWIVTNPAPPAAFVAVVDGVGINLEQLLIRFCMTQLGAGGTVSNNMLALAPYVNPTPNAVTVQLTWGNMGGLFAAGNQQAVWGVGAGF